MREVSIAQKALDSAVNRALCLWSLPGEVQAEHITVSENDTYLVKAGRYRAVLRVQRKSSVSKKMIESELAWSEALCDETPVQAPHVIRGRDGERVQSFRDSALAGRFLILFEFIPGRQPDHQRNDLEGVFERLGNIAGYAHEHASGWRFPHDFVRPPRNLETIFGPDALWGNWRAAPNVRPEIEAVLNPVEETVKARLTAFGNGPQRYGLIHADMRLANLLIHGDDIWLIDFDDCGFSWYLYDFAATISFIEDSPQVPTLRAAWVRGYRRVRSLSEAEEAEIDSFIMLRRLALLAWVGSHMDAPEAQDMAPHFAHVSAELGKAYLSRIGEVKAGL